MFSGEFAINSVKFTVSVNERLSFLVALASLFLVATFGFMLNAGAPDFDGICVGFFIAVVLPLARVLRSCCWRDKWVKSIKWNKRKWNAFTKSTQNCCENYRFGLWTVTNSGVVHLFTFSHYFEMLIRSCGMSFRSGVRSICHCSCFAIGTSVWAALNAVWFIGILLFDKVNEEKWWNAKMKWNAKKIPPKLLWHTVSVDEPSSFWVAFAPLLLAATFRVMLNAGVRDWRVGKIIVGIRTA